MNLYCKEDSVCCKCGKHHASDGKNIIIGKKAIEQLPDALKKLCSQKVFLLADTNTYSVAGKQIKALLSDSGILYTEYIFNEKGIEPNELAVGSAAMHYDTSCDTIVSLGSGVINDIGKIVSNIAHAHYVIVATAPSMDGYASATSSMIMDGIKVSLSSKCAEVIIGDTDILKNAPLHMLKAGLGDMIAKYISICEWKIGHIITGEYYCEAIADSVRGALKKCVENADELLNRDEKAVEAVFEGLILCGEAMRLAETSRPASGVEHYFSHIWDMRGLEFGEKVDLHGIQCAIGTLLSLTLYEQFKQIVPDKEKALKYAKAFDFEVWSEALRGFLGKGAEAMIAQEEKDGKYNLDKHKKRLDTIIKKWDEIIATINDELPDIESVKKLFKTLDIPVNYESACIDKAVLPMVFQSTKDIRDKYVLSRLAWDLGVIEEIVKVM